MSAKDSIDLDLSALRDAVGVLRRAAERLDPLSLSGSEAMEVVQVFSEGERVCAAGRAVAARAVERSGHWRARGHRSAAQWMAQATGIPAARPWGRYRRPVARP